MSAYPGRRPVCRRALHGFTARRRAGIAAAVGINPADDVSRTNHLPEKATMQRLIQGVQRFVREVLPGREGEFRRLAEGQSPSTLFITCSDSRIVPELITQTGPGELFVIRNAGNIVPPYTPDGGSEAAAVEYAVSVLRVQDVVVCGHTRCGAITAVRDRKSTSKLPAVRRWIRGAGLARRLFEQQSAADREAVLRRAVEANVLEQLQNLMTHPAVAERVAEHDLTLSGWVFDLETGRVLMHCTERNEFVDVQHETAVPGVPELLRAVALE
jgi:carbonic anhydrase